MSHPRRKYLILLFITIGLCGLLAAFVYNQPFVQERIGWRISVLLAEIKYAFSPPEEAVFTPNPTVAAMVQATMAAFTPTATPTPSMTPTPGPTHTQTVTPTATLEPTPIPASVQLDGIRHEYQKYNNCGPANLSMTLSFWDWEGDQRDTAAFLKPIQDDKNVMPYEMVAYVEEQTPLNVIVRVGGDLELIKRFLAAGFPVLVEKGFDVPAKDWMGHYQLITGYDDERQRFTAQDSYNGGPNLPVNYDKFKQYWRHFNYLYMVIFPPEREAEVRALLGPHADENSNFQHAAQLASTEIYTLTGRPQFFAWFNRGNNLASLKDFAGAASAYDEAFNLYPTLELEIRPYRLMWYQTGPYWAYYYTGRYDDVIGLANNTLYYTIDEPTLEESYYWRALAKEALGNVTGAIEDLRTSLVHHPEWEPALQQLERLGASP
jgi:hypothetical protein